jgi:hypothetical protein
MFYLISTLENIRKKDESKMIIKKIHRIIHFNIEFIYVNKGESR